MEAALSMLTAGPFRAKVPSVLRMPKQETDSPPLASGAAAPPPVWHPKQVRPGVEAVAPGARDGMDIQSVALPVELPGRSRADLLAPPANDVKPRRRPGPMPRSRRPLAERFWVRVNRDGPQVAGVDGRCWIWTGPTNGKLRHQGYGLVSDCQESGHKFRGAHVVSWFLRHGGWPSLFVCHKCDVKLCVRPDHLFLGTHADNMRDMKQKGRSCTGERQGSHKLNNCGVDEILEAWGAESPKEIAKRMGVSLRTVWRVWRGECWGCRTGRRAGKPRPSETIRGELASSSKLKSADVLSIAGLMRSGRTDWAAIGREFGVTGECIGFIARGKTWSWLTGIVYQRKPCPLVPAPSPEAAHG
jgi:hypothetical protein